MKINKVKIAGKIISISKPIVKEGNKYYFIKIKQSRVFDGEKHSTFFDIKVYSNNLKKSSLYILKNHLKNKPFLLIEKENLIEVHIKMR